MKKVILGGIFAAAALMPLSANAWWFDSEGNLQTECGRISGIIYPDDYPGTKDDAKEYYSIVAKSVCPSDPGPQEKPSNPGSEAPNP